MIEWGREWRDLYVAPRLETSVMSKVETGKGHGDGGLERDNGVPDDAMVDARWAV